MLERRQGPIAEELYKAVALWREANTGKAIPRDVYHVLRTLGQKERVNTKPTHNVLTREQERLNRSWQVAPSAPVDNPGLSNGSYRADTSVTQSGLWITPPPVDPSDQRTQTVTEDESGGATFRLITRPGTAKFRVRGMTQPRKRKDADRGKIRKLSRQALNRHLEHLRELEARDLYPEWMLTLTLPRNWAEVLMDEDLSPVWALRAAWERLEELRPQARRAREALRYNPNALEVLNLLREQMAEQRRLVRTAVKQCREVGPDGRKVKANFSAFLKRFDRAHGQRVDSRHSSYCAAWHRARFLIECGIYPEVKVRREAGKILQSCDTYCEAVKALRDWIDVNRYSLNSGTEPAAMIRLTRSSDGRWLVKQHDSYEVVLTLYRATWWLEFQRRGAPHLHLIFFDTAAGEIDWDKVREWAGPSWAAVVHGLRSAERYMPQRNPKLSRALHEYDDMRALWGREVADGELEASLHAIGLDMGVYNHVRAGTRLEEMREKHWGYAAKEASKYSSKKYQAQVPKNYQNVGRWWGYRKHKRVKETVVSLPIHTAETMQKNLVEPLKNALATLPKKCFRFAQKVQRFAEAVVRGEDFGYITLWGDGAVKAARRALA